MKGFNIAPGGSLAPVDEFMSPVSWLQHDHGVPHYSLSTLLGPRLRASQSSLSDGPGADALFLLFDI